MPNFGTPCIAFPPKTGIFFVVIDGFGFPWVHRLLKYVLYLMANAYVPYILLETIIKIALI